MIKPVSSSKELLDKYHSGVELYAIPETHRIVSVALLQEIVDALFSHSLTKAMKAEKDIRAIVISK